LLTTNKQKYNLEVEAKAISFLKLEMAYDELELSAVKIAKTLNENSSPLISRYVPSYYSFIKPFIKYALDYLRIVYYKINKNTRRVKTIYELLPGGITCKEVEEIITRFKDEEGYDIKIGYKNVTKDLVCIEPL
jgi:hypothetical protein